MKKINLKLVVLLGLAAIAAPLWADRPPLRAVPHAPDNWSSGTYQYDAAGNIQRIGNDVYLYDTAGRLVSATVSGVTQTYGYDAFGNRLPASATTPVTPCVSGGATPNCHQPYTVDLATNRLSSATYDAAGNVTQNEGITYAYDAVGMMTSEGSAGPAQRQYIYSATDERIAVYRNGTWDWSVRDESGKVPTEFRSQDSGASLGTANMQIVRDYIYRDHLLLASAPPNGPPDRHYHLDHLGTPRAITNASGQRVGEHVYLPFGMELKVERTLTETPEDDRKFTGHERDIRSDGLALDYMHARYYGLEWGRFLSVDPGKDWDLRQPQSWNMYAYVRNNPVNRTDPTGKWCADATSCAAVAFAGGGTGGGAATTITVGTGGTVVLVAGTGALGYAAGRAIGQTEIGGATVDERVTDALQPITDAIIGTTSATTTTTIHAPAESRSTPQIGRDRPRPGEKYGPKPKSEPPKPADPNDPKQPPKHPPTVEPKKKDLLDKIGDILDSIF